jgi:hypothetical protein
VRSIIPLELTNGSGIAIIDVSIWIRYRVLVTVYVYHCFVPSTRIVRPEQLLEIEMMWINVTVLETGHGGSAIRGTGSLRLQPAI